MSSGSSEEPLTPLSRQSSSDSSDCSDDVLIVCVSPNPPKLPLREELNSLGVEVIRNGSGKGFRASKKAAREKAASYRDHQSAMDLSERRLAPDSPNTIKKKIEERRAVEAALKHDLKALSYDSYPKKRSKAHAEEDQDDIMTNLIEGKGIFDLDRVDYDKILGRQKTNSLLGRTALNRTMDTSAEFSDDGNAEMMIELDELQREAMDIMTGISNEEEVIFEQGEEVILKEDDSCDSSEFVKSEEQRVDHSNEKSKQLNSTTPMDNSTVKNAFRKKNNLHSLRQADSVSEREEAPYYVNSVAKNFPDVAHTDKPHNQARNLSRKEIMITERNSRPQQDSWRGRILFPGKETDEEGQSPTARMMAPLPKSLTISPLPKKPRRSLSAPRTASRSKILSREAESPGNKSYSGTASSSRDLVTSSPASVKRERKRRFRITPNRGDDEGPSTPGRLLMNWKVPIFNTSHAGKGKNNNMSLRGPDSTNEGIDVKQSRKTAQKSRRERRGILFHRSNIWIASPAHDGVEISREKKNLTSQASSRLSGGLFHDTAPLLPSLSRLSPILGESHVNTSKEEEITSALPSSINQDREVSRSFQQKANTSEKEILSPSKTCDQKELKQSESVPSQVIVQTSNNEERRAAKLRQLQVNAVVSVLQSRYRAFCILELKMIPRHKAAKRIQRAWRWYHVKQRYWKDGMGPERGVGYKNSAATKIQWVWKCYQYRRDYQTAMRRKTLMRNRAAKIVANAIALNYSKKIARKALLQREAECMVKAREDRAARIISAAMIRNLSNQLAHRDLLEKKNHAALVISSALTVNMAKNMLKRKKGQRAKENAAANVIPDAFQINKAKNVLARTKAQRAKEDGASRLIAGALTVNMAKNILKRKKEQRAKENAAASVIAGVFQINKAKNVLARRKSQRAKEENASTRIAAVLLGNLNRNVFLKKKKCANTIALATRAFMLRKLLHQKIIISRQMKEEKSAKIVARAMRVNYAHRLAKKEQEMEHESQAAKLLICLLARNRFRKILDRKIQQRKLERVHKAASVIAGAFAMNKCKKAVTEKRAQQKLAIDNAAARMIAGVFAISHSKAILLKRKKERFEANQNKAATMIAGLFLVNSARKLLAQKKARKALDDRNKAARATLAKRKAQREHNKRQALASRTITRLFMVHRAKSILERKRAERHIQKQNDAARLITGLFAVKCAIKSLSRRKQYRFLKQNEAAKVITRAFIVNSARSRSLSAKESAVARKENIAIVGNKASGVSKNASTRLSVSYMLIYLFWFFYSLYSIVPHSMDSDPGVQVKELSSHQSERKSSRRWNSSLSKHRHAAFARVRRRNDKVSARHQHWHEQHKNLVCSQQQLAEVNDGGQGRSIESNVSGISRTHGTGAPPDEPHTISARPHFTTGKHRHEAFARVRQRNDAVSLYHRDWRRDNNLERKTPGDQAIHDIRMQNIGSTSNPKQHRDVASQSSTQLQHFAESEWVIKMFNN